MSYLNVSSRRVTFTCQNTFIIMLLNDILETQSTYASAQPTEAAS